MLVVRLDSIAPLLNATSILSLVAEAADFKCSPSIFSLIVSQPPSASVSVSVSGSAPRFRCCVALQTMPQFFTIFSCDQFCHHRILLHHFYTTLLDMERHRFSSFTLCLPQLLHRLVLKFQNSHHALSFRELALSAPEEDDVGEIDYTTFVSIELKEFRHVIAELNTPKSETALVILTDSRVKFVGATTEIILPTEGGKCIIGGVEGGDETQLIMILHPKMFLNMFTDDSERVWLFKSADSFNIVICAPIGLYARYLVYFS